MLTNFFGIAILETQIITLVGRALGRSPLLELAANQMLARGTFAAAGCLAVWRARRRYRAPRAAGGAHHGGSRAERLQRKAGGAMATATAKAKGGKGSASGGGGLSGRYVADVDAAGLLRIDLKHVDTFLSWRCGRELLAMGLFPGAISQEISESMACLAAATTGVGGGGGGGGGGAGLSCRDASVVCVVVGDGRTPRTAALLAMRTRWRVVSVDPALHGLCAREGAAAAAAAAAAAGGGGGGGGEVAADPARLPKEHRNAAAQRPQHSARALERRRVLREQLARIDRLHLAAAFIGGPQGVLVRLAAPGDGPQGQEQEQEQGQGQGQGQEQGQGQGQAAWGSSQGRQEERQSAAAGDVSVPLPPGGKVLIILPHAHVMPDVALACLRFEGAALAAAPPAAVAVVQLPCCKFDWHDTVTGVRPDVEVLDPRVCARARCVRVWRDVSSRFDFAAAATGPGVQAEAWGSSEAQARKRGGKKAKAAAKLNRKTKRRQQRQLGVLLPVY
jgi:hypothetical protein